MVSYLSTFISGFQEIIKEMSLKYLNPLKINEILDGAIIYDSTANINTIRQLKFFNNSFLILDNFKADLDFNKMFDKILLSEGIFSKVLSNLGKKDKDFRIMFSNENEFVSFDKSKLVNLERKIIKESKNKLRLNIYDPDFEFWFLKRREKSFFLLRFTNNLRNKLEKGELKKELTFILNYLSEPKKQDIFIDPFAGYGSIVLSRAENFPAKLIIINDLEKKYNGFWNKKLDSLKNLKLIRKNSNALNLISEKENSIDKIVTDPPWGEYKLITNKEEFYINMLKEFVRILKKEGIIILLMNRDDSFKDIIDKFNNLKLIKKIDILVSGKKASVYKLKKLAKSI